MTSLKKAARPEVYTPRDHMLAQVILASQGVDNPKPVYTLHLRYPRIIHAELMTHRVFSRNARSSRAVPVKTMLEEIRNTPFVPWHWGKNQPGMQAGESWDAKVVIPEALYTDPETPVDREAAWLWGRDQMVALAQGFTDAEYHKQIANRLLEPFMWIDVLVTSTEWSNFLWLRDHEAAEPHLRDLAVLVGQALDGAVPQILEPGQWHLPYIAEADRIQAVLWAQENQWSDDELLCKLSAARCARISYTPFDGDASYERELERYNSLVSSDRVHASPLEHQCKPDSKVDTLLYKASEGLRAELIERSQRWEKPHLHGNLEGYIQFRKITPGENHV